MKRIVVKSALAITCIVAASVSGFKAYEQHNKNVAAANMLLAENVEALSSGDASWVSWLKNFTKVGSKFCGVVSGLYICYEVADALYGNHYGWDTQQVTSQEYVGDGHYNQVVTIIKTCVNKKGWGSDECTPGQIVVIKV